MKKSTKLVSLSMVLAMSAGLFSGCGKKDSGAEFKNSNEMVDKFSAYCDLGEYKGLDYEARNTEVTDEMVQSKVDSLLEQYVVTETKTEGEAKLGDTVNIDYVGTVDGVEFSGGNTNGNGAELELGSHSYIDDFEEQVAGHKVGETFNVEVTFPDDYGNTDLAGKDAVFVTTLNSIIVKTYPSYDDAFVTANTDYTTVTDYENSVRESIAASNKLSDDNYNKANIVELVVGNTTVNEYPKEYVEKLINDTISNVEETAKGYNYDLTTYVTVVYGMASADDFKTWVSDQVQATVQEMIVICAIAKAEGISVSKDEINDYKQELITQFGITKEELDKYYTADDYMYGALAEKVVDFLLENNNPVEEGSLDTEN